MPNKNYLSGVRKERKLVNEAREKGFIAARSAGSHSPIDVFIIDKDSREIRLIQCKPKSMSQQAKDKLQNKYPFLNGLYNVRFQVI